MKDKIKGRIAENDIKRFDELSDRIVAGLEEEIGDL